MTVRSAVCLTLLTILTASCVLSTLGGPDARDKRARPDGYADVGALPFNEAFYGTYFQEDKVGFSHFRILPAGDNFKIENESTIRLTAMKKTNRISMKEEIIVRPDLTLVSLDSVMNLNDRKRRVTGRVEDGAFIIDVEVDGEKKNFRYPLEGKVYHSSAVNLMPVMKGLKDGREYTFNVFNPERRNVREVEQRVTKVVGEPGPHRAEWKVKTKFGDAEVDSWLNPQGLTVLEKAVSGSLITILEDEKTAKEFLKTANKGKDIILDFSRIRVSKPILRPTETRSLKLRVTGIRRELIPSDHRQRTTPSSDGNETAGFSLLVRCEDLPNSTSAGATLSPTERDAALAPTISIQSDHNEIVSRARKIVSEGDSDLERVQKLAQWISRNIRNSMRDSLTSVSVLRSREGECQSHANLYAAMARAVGIPTRTVTGLVYTKGVGFLYHAWAESFVGSWISVDPTLGQVPADATHVKISEDDDSGESTALLDMVGKIRLEVEEVG